MSAPGSSPGVSAQPRTPPPAPENANDAEAGRSGDLRAIVHGAACACGEEVDACRSTLRSREVDAVADAVLAAGFRRVAEDPETLRAKVRGAIYQALPAPIGHDDRRWEGSHGELTRRNYNAAVDAATDAALQVFRALRGGEQQ